MILEQLKLGTQLHHHRLESRLDLLTACDSLEHYCALLKRFYGVYAPLEERLAACDFWSDLGIDFEQRKKASLILDDLRLISTPYFEGESVAICTNLPPLETAPEALGCLYVLEGATLGGQIISRHLLDSLSVVRERGGNFFDPYGSNVGQMWKSFRSVVTDYSRENPSAEPMIVRSACDTFQLFEDWLCSASS